MPETRAKTRLSPHNPAASAPEPPQTIHKLYIHTVTQDPIPVHPLQRKLAILADAAKYDASCASSGTSKRDSRGGQGIGSTEGSGICHSYAPDGRCISLLKILLTNFCQYDCL